VGAQVGQAQDLPLPERVGDEESVSPIRHVVRQIMANNKKVTDAYQWSYDRYIKDDPELARFADEMRVKAGIAQQIYDIRNRLRMTREDLAEFSGLK
jgi:hypothetical protein